MQPGTRFCQAKPGCRCGSGSAPQQHSRAQLAPQAQARPSAATPRRRARPARLPPRQPGARALGWHIRARCGAHVPAHCAPARVPGLLPSHSAGTSGPSAAPRPALPQIVAAARLKGCARAYTRALHKMWLLFSPGGAGLNKSCTFCAMSLCGHRSPRGRAGPPARPRGLLGLLPLLPPGSTSARKARGCGGAAPAAPALAAEAGGADNIGPSGP
jgi:hypothetical protein